MMNKLIILLAGVLSISACQPQTATGSVTVAAPTLVVAYTPIPTAERFLTATPTIVPTQRATSTPVSSATPMPTAIAPTVTLTATPTQLPPTSTASPVPATPTATVALYVDHYFFERPIQRRDDLVDYVTRSYPYGGTQFGQFEVHLGADMQNPRFTPILAAGDGVVYYAGNDLTKAYGPYEDYYGNLVIIQHPQLSPEGLPLFTLYGHMQEIAVTTGQTVSVGYVIGTVGDSGIAFGPHVHFEVRAGDPENYLSTRNPDLYIKPWNGFGTLAGKLTTTTTDEMGITILVRSATSNRETYTYGGDRVNSDAAWGENFTLGDLPEGDWEVVVSSKSGKVYFRQPVRIMAGKTTWIDVPIE